ncbi:MAG: CvpA family protein [Ignavibacteriae bacterium]|nr:CvpA family protein [Ignavibacteriota bacterium]MCB0723256.1 CvpA family protein [Ignavibacteriota bacterium]MCB9243102.1 CvpA family protein [Ignavibacteriales bacterium]
MSKLDILILIIVAVPVIIGLSSGFLKNLLGFSAIVIGLFVATNFHPQIMSVFNSLSIPSQIGNGLAFAGVIVFFYVLGGYIARKISGINKFTASVDRFLGAIFGILQGLLIASVILLFLKYFNFISPENADNSLFYPFVAGVAPEILSLIAKVLPFTKSTFEDLKFLNVK